PYSAWRAIELSLEPYRRRLQANAPGLLHLYDKELREIMELFTADQFENDKKLEGEFLLSFHTQRTALWKKKPSDTDTEESQTENE
ncbi:MAG: type I-C CRISPR-associated protein Cas8c/Csd1, partial [Syntrophus sp. (in: bacteria)]